MNEGQENFFYCLGTLKYKFSTINEKNSVSTLLPINNTKLTFAQTWMISAKHFNSHKKLNSNISD